MAIVALAVCCLVSGAARGQAPQSSVEAYAEAIKQSVISQRITAMERYLTLSSGGSLKVDALEFLVWDHMRLGHPAQSLQHARELLAIAPENPVAIAVLYQDMFPGRDKNEERARLATLTSAATALNRMAKPEGMPDRNFDALRRQVSTMLHAATGMCYLRSEDYPNARLSLQVAVNSDPNNAQWVYGLGLALLNGKYKDEYRGYWYLARAVNLIGQMPQGREIADYAQRRYRESGGNPAGWQAYVASAAALDAPPSPAGSVDAASQPAPSAIAAAPSVNAAPGKTQPASASAASVPANSGFTRTSRSKSTPGFEATLHEPDRPATSPPRPLPGPKPIAPPSEAVSLGILIETSLLTGQDRPAIISTLRDIVRNLRTRDEACILVFSDQLDFEQDLTADDKLLEEALGQIRPRPGKALLSGIAFAAGHLKRIGKNSNRILLIISDGTNKADTSDTLSFRSQVTGVRIDCVGLKTAGESERAFLQRIAAYSGGTASFAANAEEFRTAALDLTRGMGIFVQ